VSRGKCDGHLRFALIGEPPILLIVPTNLLAELYDDRVDHDELLDEISAFFGSAQYDRSGVIAYPSNTASFINVTCDSSGVVDVQAGPSFDRTRFERLRQAVFNAIVDTTGPMVRAAVLFSGRPTTGQHRASEIGLQIYPVPAHAPRSDLVTAAHPFVTEFEVLGSRDWRVNVARGIRETERWTWVLNAIVTHTVRGIPSKNTPHHWVLGPSEQSAPVETRISWAQEFYGYSGFSHQPGEPAEATAPPLALIPDDIYYARQGLEVGSVLDLPESFERLTAIYATLARPQRDRFLRAAQWFYVAGEIHPLHASPGLAALVTAIETLAHEARDRSICACCGLDTAPGPTARFKEFLDRYVPEAGNKTATGRLYTLRSNIVHGLDRLLSDAPWATAFKPAVLEEREDVGTLFRATRLALVRWLGAQGTPIESAQ
jgi:hypothetical protein